jgi:hypothetical protein
MKIVVGYDGSEAATRALRRAADFAFHGAQLRVVTAAQVAMLVRDPAMAISPLDPGERDARAKTLAEARSLIADLGVEASFVAGTGDPALFHCGIGRLSAEISDGLRATTRRPKPGSSTRLCSGAHEARGTGRRLRGRRQERATWANLKHFHEDQPGLDRGPDPTT